MEDLAARIESTLLSAGATPDAVARLCGEARCFGFAGVCVNPVYVSAAATTLAGTGVRLVTVVSFPLGAGTASVRAAEARRAEADGAVEIDLVMALGLLKAGRYEAVRADLCGVRAALRHAATVLKVIVEAPLLDESELERACRLALEAGAQYVKTGTGFAGPATVADVERIRRIVGDRARIKAAGGIGDRRTAEALVAAGADRLGTSRARALVGP